MSKHSRRPRTLQERYGAAVATICVVGLLGLVVSLLAVFRPDSAPDSAPEQADLADVAGTPLESQSTLPAQEVIKSPTPLVPRVQKPRHHQRGDTSERALRKKVQDSLEQEPTSFRVATFNVLGASHTAAGGNKKGWASGSARMAMATSVIQGSGADIVGLQELEIGQARTFLGRTNGAWGLYPGPGGGTLTVRNSVAWRTSVWELVSSRTVPIPYFHGNRVPMPVVELRNRETDQTVYVMNIHNPATTSRHGNNQRWRTMAMSIELDTVRGLQDDAPVILTGDFNERSEAFCKMTSGGTMRAAVPAGAASGCGAPANTGIDWVFATPHVDFSGYLRQRSALIARATDHPFVVANATITPTDSSDE